MTAPSNVVSLADRRRAKGLPPAEPREEERPLLDLSTAATLKLWRMMWTHRSDSDTREAWLYRSAEAEWERRLDNHEKEHGAGSSSEMRDQYAAYVLGREDELAIRGKDLDIARRLFAAIGEVFKGGDVGALEAALRELTGAERLRLERGT